MYARFTDRARKVMRSANQEAQRLNHEYIGTEHILLGLVKEGSGVAANVLKNLDIDLRKIRLEIEKFVQLGPDMVAMRKWPQTPRAKKVIEYAIEEARNLNHNYVGTEHLLLGLLREQGGNAAQVLVSLGLKLEAVRQEVQQILGMNQMGQNLPSIKTCCRLSKPDSQQNPQAELQGLPAETLKTVMELDIQIEQMIQEKDKAVAECEFEKAAHLGGRVRKLKQVRDEVVSLSRGKTGSGPCRGPSAEGFELVARRAGLWVRKHQIVCIFAAGLTATLAGAMATVGFTDPERANGGALVAGGAYVLAVAFACLVSRAQKGFGRKLS